MAKTGRPSTVRNHVQRARIDSMLDDGISYAEIVRTVGGLSVASVGRYANSRKSELAKLVDNEPNVTDLTLRLIDLADAARDTRRLSKLSGPVAQTRAISAEASILGKLLGELDVRDTRETELHGQVAALVKSLQQLAKTSPESARNLIETMRAHPTLNDLTTALSAQLEK